MVYSTTFARFRTHELWFMKYTSLSRPSTRAFNSFMTLINNEPMVQAYHVSNSIQQLNFKS